MSWMARNLVDCWRRTGSEKRCWRVPTSATRQRLLSHEASCPNLQPFALGAFAAAPSIFSLAPNVRIDLPAVSAQAAKLTASIQITARMRLAGRPVAVRARAERSADQIHQQRLRTRRRIMGFWTYARQRLVPFVAALLSIALLYLLFTDVA